MELKKAYYEIIAPGEEELSNDAKKIDKIINNISPLQKSITKLIKEIDKSTQGIERNVLEQQLEELEKINKLYNEFISKNITKNSRKEIKELLVGLESQINSTENIIDDDYKKIKNILKHEDDKLEDTLDLIGANTIRDNIENNINILGIKESLTKEEYQDFFDIATITYINVIEKLINRKILLKEEGRLAKNDGLYLNEKEIYVFISELYKNLNKTNIDLKFDFEIKLKKNEYDKNYVVNLDQYKEFQEKIDKNKQIELQKKKIKEIQRKKTEKYEKNMRNISTKERMNYIDNLLDKEEFKPYLLEIINNMEGKTIYLQKNKQVKLDTKYIEENLEKLSSNLKSLILLIIEIESNGFSEAQNPISTAEGLGQWLSGNGRMSTEYMYNKKWYSKKIKGKKTDSERKVWLTSSFETTLRNIKRNYSEELLKEFEFMPNNFKKKIKTRPIDIGLRKQIKILILDLGSNTKKVRNGLGNLIGIQDYLGTAILGNKWAMKEIYKIFHHTSPDKKTLKRIDNIISKYGYDLHKVT